MSRYVTSRAAHTLAERMGARDWQVIRYVSTLRFVSGAQLARLCFADGGDTAANARAARRSLLRLVRLGIVERLPRPVGGVRAGSSGFVYCLGSAGYRLAILRGLLPGRTRRRSQVPGLLFLHHTLAIAELHTRLVECERSGRVELLALDAEPVCHRPYDGSDGQRHMLKPDSYLRMGVGSYEDSYFIEVDLATRGSRALTEQLGRYLAYYRTGQEQRGHGVFPKVLWLGETTGRVRAIEGCIASLPAASRALFAVALCGQAVPVMLELT